MTDPIVSADDLAARGVRLVGGSIVDMAGVARATYVPNRRLDDFHRVGMGEVLGTWVARGDCSIDDAVRIVDLVGADNARRVYGL